MSCSGCFDPERPRKPAVIRPQAEVDEVLDLAEAAIGGDGDAADGPSYEEGVVAALQWVTGHRSTPPVEVPG